MRINNRWENRNYVRWQQKKDRDMEETGQQNMFAQS